MALLKAVQALGQKAFERAEAGLNPVFGREANPLYHLGALAFYFYWILAVSGLYLYIFFETSIHGAYQSVEALSVEQWYLGGVLRSLHRYATDALIIAMTLHLLRMFVHDRYHRFRVFSWITGIPLIWLAFINGINGYWLVWDQLSQYIAVATSEMLDWLPIFSEPMARNFLNQEKVSDRFFSLLSFLHIGLPLVMLMVMWIHIQRVSNARSNPPRALAIGSLAALVVLALIKPALSQPPANLDHATNTIDFDWFVMSVYPLLEIWGRGGVWALLGGVTVLFTLLPWLPPRKKQPVAVVDPPNCNGCRRCFDDCPYNAIEMVNHISWPGHQMAVVLADQCASCGICAGACPSSTPFRSVTELVSGIDMPQRTVQNLITEVGEAAKKLAGPSRVVVFGCDHAASVKPLAGPGVAVVSLPCISNLPPSFIDYIYRNNWADGVLVTGCHPESCEFRRGSEWTELRIKNERQPHLKTRFARERTQIFWAARLEQTKLAKALDAYRARLSTMPSVQTSKDAESVEGTKEAVNG